MTARRDPMNHRRIGRVPGIHLVRELLRALTARAVRSAARVRETLQHPHLRTRRPAGMRHPAGSSRVIPLRAEYGSWTGDGAGTELTKPTRPTRYRRAKGPGRHNRNVADRSGTVRRDNDAITHQDEIRTAYWAGETLEALSDQWGVSPQTIVVLAYGD